ncbi:hypothetical protein WR25_15049 [Diploscapter pachys]|uniref:Uncharacterized protein n=1 Tax=Diploscapter pachys TaxID=2018661 RepID=A0A2A2L0E5_9BILA|nr:hypothetical protein WR25_15049 [Diploscapter pachys]
MSSVSFPRFSTPHPNPQFPSSPEPKKRSPQIVTFKDEPAIIPNHKTFVHDLSEVDVKESPVLQPVSSVPSKYLKMATPNAQEVPLMNWGDRGHKARVITITTTPIKNGHVESRTSPLSHYSPEELKRIAPSIKMERSVEEVSSVPISLTVVRGSAYSVKQPPFHQPISSPASRPNNSNGKFFTKATPTNGFFGRGKLLNGFGQNHIQKQQVEPQMTKGSNGLLDDDKPCIVEYEDGTVQVLN